MLAFLLYSVLSAPNTTPFFSQLPLPFPFAFCNRHAEAVAARGVPGLDSSSFAAAKSSEPSKVGVFSCPGHPRCFLLNLPAHVPPFLRLRHLTQAQLEREAKEKKEAAARAAALKAALEADDFESAVKAAEQAASKAKTEGTGGEAATDPAKRQRNLKKKLDGIRALEVCRGAQSNPAAAVISPLCPSPP